MAEENIFPIEKPVEETPTQSTPVTQPVPQHTAINTPGSKKILVKKLLLVVVLILIAAGLITAGMRFYKSWQVKQRDSQRKTDIQMLQKALKTYRGKTKDQKYYPGNLTEATLVKTGVTEKLPKDPKNEAPYIYKYSGTPAGCSANCTGYTLFACLENAKDTEGKSPKGSCQTKIYEVTK